MQSFLGPRLRAPLLPPHFVRRERLLALLDAATQSPITLVVAPAGAGKTSLVADWTRLHRRPTAWLSLEESDRAVSQLWTALTGALAAIAPQMADLSSTHVEEQPALHAVEAILAAIEDQHPDLAALVIDDLQVLDDAGEAMTVLTELVQLLPAWLRVVLLSRRTPPLPVDRLRARGLLGEVGFCELRLLPDEAAAVLARIVPDVGDDEVAVNAAAADGWAAGLQLAALAMRAERSREADSSDGATRSLMVSDYVWNEVLAREQPAVVQVLVDTSIVDRANAALAGSLTGRADAGELLLEAERRGLFVSRLGTSGWLGVHPMVREVLLARANGEAPAHVAALRVKAADWLVDAGEIPAALDQLQQAGRPRETLRVLARHAADLYDLGREATIVETVAQVPAHVTGESLEATIELAWCLLLSDHHEFVRTVDRALATAERAGAVDPTAAGRLSMLLAMSGVVTGDWNEVAPRVQTAMVRLGDSYWQDPVGRFAQVMLARDLALREKWDDLAPDVREAELELARDPGQLLALESARAMGQALAGRPIDALRTAAGVRDAVDVAHMMFQRIELKLAEALAHREIGDRARADAELTLLAELSTGPMTYARALTLLEMVELRLDEKNVSDAQLCFATAAEFMKNDMPGRAAGVRLGRVGTRLALAVGDSATALRWAGRFSDRFWEPVNRARVALADGDSERAARLLLLAEPRCLRHRVVCALLAERAQPDGGTGWLEPVLAEAAAAGLLQTVASEAAQIPTLLEKVAWQAPPEWVSRLRSASPAVLEPEAAGSLPPERLTQRELDVLRMLPSRLTLREIADELGISLNTVKFHMKVIYRKLAVSSRTEAAAAARRMAGLQRVPESRRALRG